VAQGEIKAQGWAGQIGEHLKELLAMGEIPAKGQREEREV